MRRFVVLGVAVVAVVVGAGVPHARPVAANPAKIWVINQSIANAIQGTAVDFSTPAGRTAVAPQLDLFQDVSGGLIARSAAVNATSGPMLILVETDGSGTGVSLNGHGLTCNPACNGLTMTYPDPSDHFVVYAIVDATAFAEGDSVVVTALQDGVTLDSTMLHVIVAGHVDTFAGGGAGDGNPPTKASVWSPAGLATDAIGAVYIADQGHCRLRKVSGGIITSLAGQGGPRPPPCPATGDGGPAVDANVDPSDVALDGLGNVYIADINSCHVRKIASGTITSIPGVLCSEGLAVDGSNRLLIAAGCKVWRYDGASSSAIVGSGSCGNSGDGGPANAAGITPTRLAIDKVNSYLYISDESACVVRRVTLGDATPTITTVAGTGTCGSTADPGPAASAQLNAPVGVAVDSSGRLYIADTANCRVRRVDFSVVTPQISTVAGTGVCGLTPDPGPATSAQLSLQRSAYFPYPFGASAGSGIAIDASDNLYISDGNCLVREVSAGTISTFAGNGSCEYSGGDGGPANAAGVAGPWGVVSRGASVFVSESAGCRIREITGGVISTIAGTGVCGVSADGVAASAMLDNPSGIAIDASNHLYVSDSGSCRVRMVNLSALPPTVTTIAGTGICGSSVDPGPALSAQLNAPGGLRVAANGDIYVADRGNCIIRKISAGVISTVAGTGTCGVGPASGAALSVPLDWPTDLAIDGSGNLFISDSAACVVRELSGGTLTTVAGTFNGAPGYCNASPFDGPATSTDLGYPTGLAFDASGTLYFADGQGCLVRSLVGGAVTKYAGYTPSTTYCAYLGDGGAATAAAFHNPDGITFDDIGNLYVADSLNDRLRIVAAADSDGDGCPDAKESLLVPPTSYLNAWDFYSVPVPALFAAPNPLADFKGRSLSAANAEAVFGYFKKVAKAGSVEYEQDLNGNGIKDGVEYDRSVVTGAPGVSGPPDGIISASDAQLAFAQFKLGYHC